MTVPILLLINVKDEVFAKYILSNLIFWKSIVKQVKKQASAKISFYSQFSKNFSYKKRNLSYYQVNELNSYSQLSLNIYNKY